MEAGAAQGETRGQGLLLWGFPKSPDSRQKCWPLSSGVQHVSPGPILPKTMPVPGSPGACRPQLRLCEGSTTTFSSWSVAPLSAWRGEEGLPSHVLEHRLSTSCVHAPRGVSHLSLDMTLAQAPPSPRLSEARRHPDSPGHAAGGRALLGCQLATTILSPGFSAGGTPAPLETCNNTWRHF